MHEFLKQVLDAHGGLARWNSYRQLAATVVSGGELWGRKGITIDDTPRRVTADTSAQRSTITPYGAPEFTMTFTPQRLVIENAAQAVIAERDNPRAAFAGHELDTPWDPLHRAYFSGYALWSYLAAPFMLALPGVQVEEVAPWDENGETWRVLRATFPDGFAGHSQVQDFYFGPDLLMRRFDYQVDISGSFLTAQYLYNYIEVDGFRFPTKRRAHVRRTDGRADFEHTWVWIEQRDYQLIK